MINGIDPFGHPDGSKLDFTDLQRSFVKFTDVAAWGGLALDPEDLSARVLVGRKGSGKTLYQRRQRAHTKSLTDVLSFRREMEPPLTDLVVDFGFHVRDHRPVEYWKLAWNRSILRATVTQVLATPSLAQRLSPSLERSLRNDFTKLLETTNLGQDALGVFSAIKAILRDHPTFNSIRSYLMHDDWTHLKIRLEEGLRAIPPLCFYLDSIDEYYEMAPRQWLDCQVGLFLCIMDLIQDDRYSSLHIFTALRDVVVLRIRQSEHGLRYLGDLYVRRLDWDMKASLYLLEHKASMLPDDRCKKPEFKDRPLLRWLGQDTVSVAKRGTPEPVQQYLLRHTRLLPRDVIILGNMICHEIAHAGYFPSLASTKDPIGDAVHSAAMDFGNELLISCAQYILLDAMPSAAVKHGYTSNYLEHSAGLHDDMVKRLRQFITKSIRAERFTGKRLATIEREAANLFGATTDVLTAMWLNGLLGFVDGKRADQVAYYSDHHVGDLDFPRHRSRFVLHPSMTDVLPLKFRGPALVPIT
jgi:hypothetical protein